MRYGKAFAIGSALCAAGMAGTASAATIAQYNFDSIGADNKTFTDISNNASNHDAVYSSAVTLQNADPFPLDDTANPANNRSVVQGGAIAGANNPGTMNFNPTNSNTGQNSLTIEGWVNLSSLPTSTAYLVELTASKTSDPNANNAASDIYLAIDTSGKAYVNFNSRNGVKTITGISTLQTGVWTHLAFTYSLKVGDTGNSYGYLYVNGTEEGSFKYGRLLPTGLTGAYIGGNGAGTYAIPGAIDDVRISDLALSNSPTAPQAQQLGYYYSFSAVPEPTTAAVLAVGGLMLIRRRRRA
jgi:hypothetical protein